MSKLFIEDLILKGKKVIVRVDFNVPLRDGKVENDKRLRASLPTINFLREVGAHIILMSHLGRPKGKVVEDLRLKPVAEALGKLLDAPVKYAEDCVGEAVTDMVKGLKNSEVLLLENLRFHPEEEKNDEAFAKQLAALAEVYVNDAFGTAHRAHASTEGITHFIPSCAAGYLMKAELDYLDGKLKNPSSPFIAIIGGAKVSSKIGVIEALLDRVDKLILGGAMTHTFMKAQGREIGKSVFEEDKVDLAKSLLEKGGDKIVLPTDYLVSKDFDFGARTVGEIKTVDTDSIPADAFALDIGPESVKNYCSLISSGKAVIWNGPMGVCEIEATAVGTNEVAKALVEATEKGGITVVGGGDSAAAIEAAGLGDKVSHVSTGGGASLEFMEGKTLPGVEALTDK